MFGAIRKPSSSVESLELERKLPSKLPKSDPFSVYEATLQKLRLGSQRAFNPSMEDSALKDEKKNESSDQSNDSTQPYNRASIFRETKFGH